MFTQRNPKLGSHPRSLPIRRAAILIMIATAASLVCKPQSLSAACIPSGQGVPVDVTTPSSDYTGPQDTSGSVTVTSVPSGGCYVQVGCDHPSLVSSPSGSWPYNLQYPNGGSTTQNMTLTLSAVSQDTVVVLYACKSGVDSSNPANWTATRTITLHP